jgi:transposase InsO family protein
MLLGRKDRRGQRGLISSQLQVSERTLVNWVRGAIQVARQLGRPARSASERFRALLAVRRQVKALGWSVGWRPIEYRLHGKVPTRLVQESLSRLKARHRKRLREKAEKNRVSVKVLAKDVIWSQDAAHIGRVEEESLLAEVIKDRATLGYEGLAVGPSSTAEDILAMLEWQKIEQGLPLVWSTDNGSAYKNEKLADYLRREKVIHLISRPRTPQDNGAAERGICELKAESGLGKGIRLHDAREAASCLAKTWVMLDSRPRASKGYQNAVQLENSLAKGPELVDRAVFYTEACRNIEKAVQGGETSREKRKAERQAIFETLEKNRLINIVRGGKTHPA